MSGLISAIKSGGTDERLYSIEMALKVCQTQYNNLLNATVPEQSTQPDHTAKSNSKDFYLNLLK